MNLRESEHSAGGGDLPSPDLPPSVESFFETIPGLYLLVDPDLRILNASDAFLQATLTDRAEIVGRELFDVFPDHPVDASSTRESSLRGSLERVKRTLKPDSMPAQKQYVLALTEPGDESETRYTSCVNTPILGADGELSHIVHRAEDVTGLVELRGENDEQHKAIVQLRASSDAKNSFLSRMSHELRSPLTAVIGYSDLLILDAPAGSEEMQSAEAIFRAGEHLLTLINDVLDISQVESGEMAMSIEPAALQNALISATELVRPFANSHAVTLELPTRPTALYAKADPKRLTQVLVNLLSNAIKYNKPGGRVRIDVAEKGEGRVRVSVTDTGPGIDEDGLVKLFRPFERLGAEATEIEGTGLGLSLSRALVERMGGSIQVDSTLGVGSTFVVELTKVEPKLLADSEVPSASTLSVVEYAKKQNVLYIEDASENFLLVQRILDRRPQVTVISAMHGMLGVQSAREHHPSLILLDLHLPDVNGSEVLARLKSDAATCEIPVVVLSADVAGGQSAEVLALGAAAYLTKPIRVAALLETVDDFLL